MCINNELKKYRIKFFLQEFSRNAKYIGIFSVVLTFFFDSIVFSLLSLFAIFAIVEVVLDFSVHKAGILQYVGIIINKIKHGNKTPSISNYENEIEYSLPFKGKWIAINGSYTKEHSHSWSIPTQRYAYDFVIIDEKGKTFENELNKNKNYYCYDKDILAPADGEVVEVYNKAEDSIILKPGKFLSRSPHVAGNYIIIKHTENEYSTLAHLKKDSIRVNKGDKVLRGEVIAKCGNTGNSTEPHLHFQLQGGRSFYNSIGLPIKFRDIMIETPPMEYKKIDPRTTISKEEIIEGYITRGYIVYNN
ncbi:M23 family metallopeptidase [Natranaerobius thermophilus]|uniref:Peptidase M23 n=1 Tax=Natranaerobius thermophilus (strain ATCC BAA-1301 / DSM 18059 / JW/NM-WN-LF) TaxID=457570 RepID=B2A4U4_NATTJ|nr:M23 family metallopeptidase [Natranaerobius thermophilus]ACB83866.1 Peptidase M23 [Natranaerobius thermophilus JW/NM-WN-LF]